MEELTTIKQSLVEGESILVSVPAKVILSSGTLALTSQARLLFAKTELGRVGLDEWKASDIESLELDAGILGTKLKVCLDGRLLADELEVSPEDGEAIVRAWQELGGQGRAAPADQARLRPPSSVEPRGKPASSKPVSVPARKPRLVSERLEAELERFQAIQAPGLFARLMSWLSGQPSPAEEAAAQLLTVAGEEGVPVEALLEQAQAKLRHESPVMQALEASAAVGLQPKPSRPVKKRPPKPKGGSKKRRSDGSHPSATGLVPGTVLPAKGLHPGGLAPFLSMPRHKLTYMAFHMKTPYRTHEHQKKNGGVRVIHEPCQGLKRVQRRLLKRLLDKAVLHPSCHGFRVDCSIASNARRHQAKEVVVCVDIKDFFPSVTYPRVLGVFRSLGFSSKDAILLARLTTFRGVLPQGAPTSPQLANMVCRRLDRRLAGLASSLGADYTRYADDLAFSGPADLIKALPLVEKIVGEEGFRLAKAKTRVMRKGSRQQVCGLVVNAKAALPREDRRRLRAMFHRATVPPSKRRGPAEPPNVLAGYRALIHMIREG